MVFWIWIYLKSNSMGYQGGPSLSHLSPVPGSGLTRVPGGSSVSHRGPAKTVDRIPFISDPDPFDNITGPPSA